MRHEVKYSGLSANPSDYDCLEGEMATMRNLIAEDNALKPIPAPIVEQSFSARRPSNVWVRETSSFRHYIYHFGDSLYYRVAGKEDDGDQVLCYLGDVEVYNLEIIGNTLVAITSSGLHYILWKPETQVYEYLGNGLPECPISFGLQNIDGIKHSEEFTASTTDVSDATSTILARANKIIAEEIIAQGKFIFPFFVRYAYRLYDDTTLSHHSAPILMFPSTTEGIFAEWGLTNNGDNAVTLEYTPATLDYQALLSSGEYDNLKRWRDVIKSIDIFISAPIYTYDQNGTVEILTATSGLPSYTTDSCSVTKPKDGDYYKVTALGTHPSYHRLPLRSYSDIKDDIEGCSHFYLVRSIPIESLVCDERATLYLDDLSNLTTRELMTDDYQTHDALVAKFSQVYNGRLNIANIQRRLFGGYNLASMVCYRNEPDTGTAEVSTLVLTANGGATVQGGSTDKLTIDSHTFSYVFYPDMAAYGMGIKLYDGGSIYLNTYRLEPHPFLNGAVRFKGFPTANKDVLEQDFEWESSAAADPIIDMPNKIYTSEINNPYYFPLNGINSIGIGEIYGIRSAAKALSEGQFGTYPLYAFTSEGVWALEVTPTGGYNAIKPIIEDVCLSSKSIVQMDDSVAFASQRGIMLLSGSNAICISEALNNDYPFQFETLPYYNQITTVYYELIPFSEFVKNCTMAWDYFHQRLIVFGGALYAYVFSLRSKRWGIIEGDGNTKVLRSYPEALALNNEGFLVNYSAPTTGTVTTSVLAVSRPIKLAETDALKQITSIIQRGVFRKGAISTVLYGSRDMFNWHLISSSKDHYLRGFRGTPYKYFRVVVNGTLQGDESISGCSIDFEYKQTNHTR